ncbi:lipase family protein [Actinopolyspora mortivallis]|uniref:lipase family protein n=1 Tax=Actinopolyspora mortivallis TaxID=33906 RepID=UPI000527D5BE|nr:membrane protein [Actinopolyspora mortivallis]
MHVPGPDTRVVELRVHGILGTKPQDLTDSVASVDVAGDGVGRIVRPADRLLRPVPGPDLTAGERTVPRSIEGYVWGDMTSGGSKALWALLFPFALANMAHWMLPPTETGSRPLRWLGGTLRAGIRLTALLLTMLFVAHLTVLSLDLIASQCLRPGAECLPPFPEGARVFQAPRSVVAMAFVSAVVLGMHRLSARSWRVCGRRGPESTSPARSPRLPGAEVVRDPETPALRILHTVAGLCAMLLIALGGPAPSPDPRWWVTAVLTVGCVVGVLLLDDPTDSEGRAEPPFRRAVRTVLSRRPRRVLVAFTMLVVLVTAPTVELNGPLAGSGPVIELLTVGMLVSCGFVALLLVPTVLLARDRWRGLPARLRPWAGGWFAAPVLLIACLLGTGFGAGLTLTTREALGGRPLLPDSYDTATLLWGSATALLVTAGFVLVPWVWLRWWNTLRGAEPVSAEVELLHAGRSADQRSAERAWKWAELQRAHGHKAVLVLAGVLSAGAVTAAALRLGFSHPPFWGRWLMVLGVGTLATLAAFLLRMVYLAVRRPEAARELGVLCDLTLFWPREAHPMVPPCYALKVVPELVNRAREHLEDPHTRVVITGHSQGSLLASVATARLLRELDERDRRRVGLVTAGSQLQWAYARGFPAVLGHDSQRELAGELDGRWRSLCRGTDPIGGGVSTWSRQVYDGKLLGVGFRPDGTTGPLPAAARGPTGALVLGGDHWLPDPQRGPFEHRRWMAGLLRHWEYSGDPEWDRAVSMAAGLEIPARGTQLPLSTPVAGVAAHSPTLNGAPQPASPDGSPPERSAPVIPLEPAAPEQSPLRHGGAAETRGTGEDTPAEPRPEQAGAPAEPSGTRRTVTDPTTETFDPPGITPPWERGPALRPSGH